MKADKDFVTRPMTSEQRKAIAVEYLGRVDRGEDLIDLFAESARVQFPKWGVAVGHKQIRKLFADIGTIIRSINHHHAHLNIIVQDDMLVAEGSSDGVTTDGVKWRAGVTHAGLWCDVFEIRDFKIQRLYVYLDPDYGSHDTERYPWLAS